MSNPHPTMLRRHGINTVVVMLWLASALGCSVAVPSTEQPAPATDNSGGDTPSAANDPARCRPSGVIPIASPATSLPSTDSSAGISRFSFIVYGDTRGSSDGLWIQRDHERVVESMLAAIKGRANGPDAIRFVLQSGDAVTDGRVAAQWNASYSPLINRITVGAGVPVFSSVGNHDISRLPVASPPERVAGLCNYLAANARLIPAVGSRHRFRDYPSYGFGFGNTFVLTFDATIAEDTAQFSWVKAELARLDRRRFPHVVVFVHQPPISSGPHGGPLVEPASAALRFYYMPMFREHHVRLVLSGHDHLFEHWVERYRDSTGAHRLDHIVSGGGGAPAYGYAGEPDLREYLADGAAEQLKIEHLVRPSPTPRQNPLHFVVITVNGDEFRVEVVGVGAGKGFSPYSGRSTMVLSDP